MASWQDVLKATGQAIERYRSGNATQGDLEQMRLASNRAYTYTLDVAGGGGAHRNGSEVINQARTIVLGSALGQVHQLQMSGDQVWCEDCCGYYLPHEHE